MLKVQCTCLLLRNYTYCEWQYLPILYLWVLDKKNMRKREQKKSDKFKTCLKLIKKNISTYKLNLKRISKIN